MVLAFEFHQNGPSCRSCLVFRGYKRCNGTDFSPSEELSVPLQGFRRAGIVQGAYTGQSENRAQKHPPAIMLQMGIGLNKDFPINLGFFLQIVLKACNQDLHALVDAQS